MNPQSFLQSVTLNQGIDIPTLGNLLSDNQVNIDQKLSSISIPIQVSYSIAKIKSVEIQALLGMGLYLTLDRSVLVGNNNTEVSTYIGDNRVIAKAGGELRIGTMLTTPIGRSTSVYLQPMYRPMLNAISGDIEGQLSFWQVNTGLIYKL